MSRRTRKEQPELLYGKKHYVIMGAAVLLVIIGFFLMSGGGMEDPNVWKPEEIYSFRRITLAPFVVLLGLGVFAYALFFQTPEDKEAESAYQEKNQPQEEAPETI
ncbi:DUF3098 domain-containing protein [Saprospira sp. CCB-QB6]|uniref:DUF3098 domain-containing protein n=1 Tax=Saprospira sp. CCB-QB6 TaxID=3023936 RepID=UPI00234A5EAF|nr:DUF3098 domain-containing protein [Saprospira sp. CCB-QB6]WCL80826.1 DUF3098 domain-containing protein [Saprospira sp. CCB-QB6]